MSEHTTIVVPCYNEERRLNVGSLARYGQQTPQVRFILVDDGSTDSTPQLLAQLVSDDPEHFQVLRLATNSGQGEAVRRGLQLAFDQGARYAGFWDADLATPLDEISRFEQVLDDNPGVLCVFGSRIKLLGTSVARRPLRHYLGRVFATATSMALDLPIYDSQCGAKLFRRCEATERLFAEPFISRWIFDVEIIARLIEQQAGGADGRDPAVGQQIYELPLQHWRDVPGSKLGVGAFVRAPFELYRIRRRHLR